MGLWAQGPQSHRLREFRLSIVVGHEELAIEHEGARDVQNIQRSSSEPWGIQATELRGSDEGGSPHQVRQVKATLVDVVLQIGERALALVEAKIPAKDRKRDAVYYLGAAVKSEWKGPAHSLAPCAKCSRTVVVNVEPA